ncbi:MAG: hypothetical protein Q9220_006072 [cf. Caloplaca sp. 1 TL-2023]
MNYDLKGKAPAILLDSLVLVTGISGYIGSHVADQLLQAGYRVRGSVRDESKAAWVTDLFVKRYGQGKVETVIVPDMASPGAFDEACKGTSAVAHVASDMSDSPDPHKVIPSVIAGALNVASAASRQASIKRFVYTSSSTAMTCPLLNQPYTITNLMWNESDVAKAWAPPPYHPDRAFTVYAASKTQAEQAMWKFVKEEKPGWGFNAVLPNFNMGTVLSDKQSASTGAAVKTIYATGSAREAAERYPPQWVVDVQDVARLHVAALVDPKVEGQRILAFAHPFNWNDVLGLMRGMYPNRKFEGDVEGDVEGLGRDLSTLDNHPGKEMLRKFGRQGWASLEESIRDNVGVL